MKLYYTSPEMMIDSHFWRIVVTDSRFGGRSSAHQFRSLDTDAWQDYHNWPTYNFNDGTNAGLPPELHNLWEVVKDEVTAALVDHGTLVLECDLKRHCLSGVFFITDDAKPVVNELGLDNVLAWFNKPRDSVLVGDILSIGETKLKAYFGYDATKPNGEAFFVRISAA